MSPACGPRLCTKLAYGASMTWAGNDAGKDGSARPEPDRRSRPGRRNGQRRSPLRPLLSDLAWVDKVQGLDSSGLRKIESNRGSQRSPSHEPRRHPCTSHNALSAVSRVVIDSPFRGSGSSSDARPSASPERVARRGSRWTDAPCEGFLPPCESRPSRTGRAEGSGATKRPLRLEHLEGTRASVPGHDGRPVGSLRLERQYRDRKASWRPVDKTDPKECHGKT